MHNDANIRLFHLLIGLLLIALQAASLDYFLVIFEDGGSFYWLAWIAADILVTVLFIAIHIAGERGIRQYELPADLADGRDDPQVHHMGILSYSWISWLFYSLTLAVKVVFLFERFVPKLEGNVPSLNTLEFTLAATGGIFGVLFSGFGHLATTAQRHYIRWMQHYVVLEIIDTVEFLVLLFAAAEDPEKGHLPLHLKKAVLGMVFINLLLPAHALFWLSRKRRREILQNRSYLTQTVAGTLCGNIPYFIVRVYLWNKANLVVGLFTMKNVIGVFQDLHEISEYIHTRKADSDGSKKLDTMDEADSEAL